MFCSGVHRVLSGGGSGAINITLVSNPLPREKESNSFPGFSRLSQTLLVSHPSSLLLSLSRFTVTLVNHPLPRTNLVSSRLARQPIVLSLSLLYSLCSVSLSHTLSRYILLPFPPLVNRCVATVPKTLTFQSLLSHGRSIFNLSIVRLCCRFLDDNRFS